MKRKNLEEKKFDLDFVINELTSSLSDMYKIPIIKQEMNVIFNIIDSISVEKLKELFRIDFVENVTVLCNQFSLILEIRLTNQILINKRQKNESEMNISSLFKLEKEIQFFPPKVKNLKISEENFLQLNDLLKTVLFILYNDNVSVLESKYKRKPPFYMILIELNQKSVEAKTLFKIKQISKKIKFLHVRFDTDQKKLKVNLKLKI